MSWWKFWKTKETPVAETPKTSDVEIVEKQVPVLGVRLKTLNAIGEKRTNSSELRITRNDAGTYLFPLDGGFATYADSNLLRELADQMDAQQALDAAEKELNEAGTGSDG